MIDYFYAQINASSFFRCLKESNVRNDVPANSIMTYSIYDTSAMAGTNYSITNASGAITYAGSACYKQASSYSFGVVYFDEFGVTNGVNTVDSMYINTPEIQNNTIGTAFSKIPAINFSINNAPPSWAKSFSFVRTNNLKIGRAHV